MCWFCAGGGGKDNEDKLINDNIMIESWNLIYSIFIQWFF